MCQHEVRQEQEKITMKKDISVSVDVYCTWSGTPPIYRLYINDELFAERKYIWQGGYLTETFHVSAPPGEYCMRYEIVTPDPASISVKNFKIIYGADTAIIYDNILRIQR